MRGKRERPRVAHVVQVRVEQVAHTEGRSSQRCAHRDYGKKLFRVVSELKKRLPPAPAARRRPRPMRTLQASARSYPALPEIALSPPANIASRAAGAQ